jgi:hypothetical protein
MRIWPARFGEGGVHWDKQNANNAPKRGGTKNSAGQDLLVSVTAVVGGVRQKLAEFLEVLLRLLAAELLNLLVRHSLDTHVGSLLAPIEHP